MRNKGYLFSVLQLVIFILSITTEWYAVLSIVLSVLVLLMILDKLGRGIVLREMMALHSCFVCLLVPLSGYYIYNGSNALTLLWGRVMPVRADLYFAYALPAITGFILTLCWPVNKAEYADYGSALQRVVDKSKTILQRRPNIGVWLLVIGVIASNIFLYMPLALQFALQLFYFSAFAGLLYVYFTPQKKFKYLILLLFALFILYGALQSGMFTIVAYMGITMFSFFFLGRKSPLWKKFIVFVLSAFALFLIQIVKQNYRQQTWAKKYSGNKALLFSNLVQQRVSSSEGLLNVDAFFPIYYRANQGFNVGLVMKRFPSIKPFDDGVNLLQTLAASLVPRVLWPDKPEAGGKFNMQYYAGYIIKGWSTNIGPLGEAYGSFGAAGGVFYLLFLGAFIRWAYRLVFIIARKIPLLLFWIPVLFYQVTYSAESDTLQVLNSLLKSALFVWMLYKIFPVCLGVVSRYQRPKPSQVLVLPEIAPGTE